MISIPRKIDSNLLRSKFRGCLLGNLMGDCFGAQFENETYTGSSKYMVQQFFDGMEAGKSVPVKKYTGNFSYTKTVAKWLTKIENKPNYEHLARLFCENFISDPKRSCNKLSLTILQKMDQSDFKDVFAPAREAFGGVGSYGNGAASRIAPISLFFHHDLKLMFEVAKNSSLLTHANENAVIGTIFQCMAIRNCLFLQKEDKIDVKKFIEDLRKEIVVLENVGGALQSFTIISPMRNKHSIILQKKDNEDLIYNNALTIILDILDGKFSTQEQQDNEAIELLGTDFTAGRSIPIALFCFFRALKEIDPLKTKNILSRAIQYAISLGGDTDSIASMTGAMAGAYLGEEAITPCLKKNMENVKNTVILADELFEAHMMLANK